MVVSARDTPEVGLCRPCPTVRSVLLTGEFQRTPASSQGLLTLSYTRFSISCQRLFQIPPGYWPFSPGFQRYPQLSLWKVLILRWKNWVCDLPAKILSHTLPSLLYVWIDKIQKGKTSCTEILCLKWGFSVWVGTNEEKAIKWDISVNNGAVMLSVCLYFFQEK